MKKPRTTQPQVPVRAIEKLVDYLEYDEHKHYEEHRLDGPCRDHIWHSVKAVAAWLDTVSDRSSRLAAANAREAARVQKMYAKVVASRRQDA